MASAEQKTKMINRLKRAEGQLRGVQRMIEEDLECVDIVTQLSAVRSSVDRMMGMIMVENLKNILQDVASKRPDQEERLEQAIKLIINK